MSEAPENIVERMGRRVRRFTTRWRAELGSSSEPRETDELPEFDELESLSASSASRSLSWAEHQRREIARMTGMNLSDVTDEFVENYNERKDNGSSMFFTEAIRKARKIQKRFPKKYLCGGLALSLYGVIKREKFSDIDFVSFEANVVDNECVSLECDKPYKHCLFLSPDVEMGSVIDGIRLQKLDQIIYWKMRYNRPKDKEDLKEYLDKQFLKAEDFKL